MVELRRLNAPGSSDCAARERAVVSERKRGLHAAASEAREARGVYSRIKRQALEHACVGCFLAVREGSSPAMRALSWRGAYLPTDV
jgi:hypothetical protein